MQGQGSAVKNWRALPGCYPSIFGKNAGAGQCSKKLASATARGLPRYLWQKCRDKAWQGSAVKNSRALPLGGYPSSLGKMQGQGSAAKIGERYRKGVYPSSLGKMHGQGSATKIGERYRWGATPLSLGKMQGQGSAVKSWSALLGKCRGRAVQ